jgi:hypothetical protein
MWVGRKADMSGSRPTYIRPTAKKNGPRFRGPLYLLHP